MSYIAVLDRLAEFASLPENWNSYGGLPMDWRAGNLAAEIARKLIQYGHPTPTLIPCSDGGVQLEWASDGAEYEVKVPPVGMVIMFMERPGDIDSEGWVSREQAIDCILRFAA